MMTPDCTYIVKMTKGDPLNHYVSMGGLAGANGAQLRVSGSNIGWGKKLHSKNIAKSSKNVTSVDRTQYLQIHRIFCLE